MTFNAREISLFQGEPLQVVSFRRGNLVWRYATGDREQEVDGQIYTAPGGVTISDIKDSSERAKNRITIRLPTGLEVAENWLPYPTTGYVLVTVLAVHRGDPDFTVAWTGRVIGPKFTDTTIELACEPSRSTTKNRGNNLRWQKGCPLAYLSQGLGMCNKNPDDVRVMAELLDKDGTTLTAAEYDALPARRLEGGYIRWIRPDGEPDYRTIMDHVGEEIVIDYDTDAMPIGTELETLPGCRHDWEDCAANENTDNYGGCAYMPVKSPHDGNPVQ